MSLTRLPRNFLQLRFYCAQQSSAAQQQPTEKKIDVFLNPTVQEHLQKLTGLDYDKVFRVRRRGQSIAPPTYKFVTAAQLEKMKARAKARAMERLQMPPVMDERVPVNKVLSEDPEIRGYEKAKMVFTDITYGVHDRNRIIVVGAKKLCC